MVALQHDPCGDEEKNKYDHPIPSREAILNVLEKGPLEFKRVVDQLDSPKWSEDPLRRRLIAMCRDEQLVFGDGLYALKRPSQLITAKSSCCEVGHLAIQVGRYQLFLSTRHAQGLFPSDRVIVRLPKKVQLDSVPVVVKVLESEKRHIACLYTTIRGKSRVIPFDRRIKNHLVFQQYQDIPKESVIWVRRSKRANLATIYEC